jgi:polar amino acid transport system substrate-binding protein
MTITTVRQQVLDFSMPYYYTPAVVAVLKDSGFKSLSDLSGKALCAGVSTTYEDWLNGKLALPASSVFAQPPSGVTEVGLDTDQFCAQALTSGRKDFVGYVTSQTVVNANIAAGMPVMQLGTPVYAEDLAASFDKKSTLPDASLVAEVDKLFAAMHSDGRLTALSNKWFKEDLTQAPK